MGFYQMDANHVFSDKLDFRENLVLKVFSMDISNFLQKVIFEISM